jgi:integrase
MRRVFRFDVRRHLLTSNPVADFDQQDAGGPERKRRRARSRGELIYKSCLKRCGSRPSFGGENFLAIKLLLAFGVRKGELLKATWDEFDSKAGQIPGQSGDCQATARKPASR